MAAALLVARLVLAAVFVAAALAKLADRDGFRKAVGHFGLPPRLLHILAALIPVAELAVAVALLPAATARWGALGSVVLLGSFTIGIAVNLARGNKPDCRCFGQLHSTPLGWMTLVRNGALLVVAGLVLSEGWTDPGPIALSWLGDLSGTALVGIVGGAIVAGLFAVQGWFLLNLLRQQGRLLVRLDALEARLNPEATPSSLAASLHGLPVGSPAPDFALPGLLGETFTLRSLRSTGPVMLIFTDPRCGPCAALMPEISRWQHDHASTLTIALVSRGDAEKNQAKPSHEAVRNVLLQEAYEVADSYRFTGTPSAVVVNADGMIASPMASGADAIRSLVARTVGRPMPVPVVLGNGNGNGHAHRAAVTAVGQPAPPLALPDLDGNIVNLSDFGGRRTLLLFWNPGCGFCSQMLDDLRAWDAEPPDGAPRLVVVSAGTVDHGRAMALRSLVLVDANATAGSSFGIHGTPMGVLIDAAGQVASDLAAGASAVFALARGADMSPSDGEGIQARPDEPQQFQAAPAAAKSDRVSTGEGVR